MRAAKTLCAGLALVLSLLSAPFAMAQSEAQPASPVTPELRRGVNVLGYDPIWRDAGKARFQARHFAEIKRAGFDFVRVNLQAFDHMDGQDTLNREWVERLDWVVQNATEAGLSVIIDEHDLDKCSDNFATCRPRLTAFWRQVAPHLAHAPTSVVFELLNEPHGQIDADRWNALSGELLAVVRETNPNRTVIVGPVGWNSPKELPSLRLPETDRNILVTFHYYDPFNFTHQGAPWASLKDVSGVTWTQAERAQIRSDFAQVAAWSQANGRPVLLGEFGAYDGSGTPVAMRAEYAGAVAREAEAAGFGWSYWQFDSDFIVWDMANDQWNRPILDALIPPGDGTPK